MAHEFVFVDQSGADTKGVLQQSRKRIRSQARLHTISRWKTNRMRSIEIQLVNTPEADQAGESTKPARVRRKKAITTKVTGPSIKTEDEPISSVASASVELRIEETEHRKNFQRILWDVPLNGYEKARSEHNFELNWLAAMAMNHVGRTHTDDNPSIPSFHRTTMHDWLDLPECSFLEQIPAFYDFSPLVRDLVDAMLVKSQHVLSYTKKDRALEHRVLHSYGKALRGVQEALKDADRVHSAETLCATQLIQLYELLDHGPPSVWIAHTNGMHKLIRLRGPERFTTRLERSLLCTQFLHIFNQAFMHNQDCFLEENGWQELLGRMVEEPALGVRAVQIELWKRIALLPRLLRQCSEVVLDASSRLEKSLLLGQLRSLKRRIVDWRTAYLKTPQMLPLSPVLSQGLLSVSLSINSIVNRLLIALQPSAADAVELEQETQDFAGKVMTLRTGKIVTSGFYIGMIAKATKGEWMGVAEARGNVVDGSRDLVKGAVWVRWNAMMGRTGGVYGSFWPRPQAQGKDAG